MENDGYGKTDHAQWASPLLARHRFAAVACARCLTNRWLDIGAAMARWIDNLRHSQLRKRCPVNPSQIQGFTGPHSLWCSASSTRTRRCIAGIALREGCSNTSGDGPSCWFAFGSSLWGLQGIRCWSLTVENNGGDRSAVFEHCSLWRHHREEDLGSSSFSAGTLSICAL